MRKLITGAVVALALSGAAAIAGAAPAQAAGVTFDFGNVAIGLSDGYYDHDRHFHRWSARQARQWRREHYSRYYGWRHNDRRYRHYRYHY